MVFRELDYELSKITYNGLTFDMLKTKGVVGMTFKDLSFSVALDYAKKGWSIQGSGWNGSGLIVKVQYPDEGSANTLPYLYIQYPKDAKTTPGARCPWLASQTDLMAEDWTVMSND